MLGAIGGDIVGSRFEGHPSPPPGFELFHRGCRFTDDTVCTLAVADALLRKEDFASSLRRYVRRYPDRGYGGMFLRWAMADDAPPYGSWGNGAPMRVAGIGWLADGADDARAMARAQAAVSHDHADAMAAAEAVAWAIHLLLNGHSARDVRRRLESEFGYDLDPGSALLPRGFDVSAAGTVEPALAAALHVGDWETAVRSVVGLGGDTDTLACIAGGVAEAAYGLPENIADRVVSYLTPDLLHVVDAFRGRLART
ncbi:MAG: ADP-ribosylglycohydrolase family protein [Pseudomonadales bacterium]